MRQTWDEVLSASEKANFVGREQEILLVKEAFSLAHPKKLITYISGQGGVGKTALSRQLQEVARSIGYRVATSDELQNDVPTVLGVFSEQLQEQGIRLRRFEERYKKYRQLMNSIEADPEAPHGLASILGKTIVRVGFTLADEIPVVKQGAKYVDQEVIETHASEWADYLVKKFANKDEIELVRSPARILTPIFFVELNENVSEGSRVLFCFDNYEYTRSFLDAWLERLPNIQLSWHIRFLIAGRTPPGPSWDTLKRIVQHIRLEVFTEEEAESFLDLQNVHTPSLREEIVEMSGRLPVIMSWLTSVEPESSDYSLPTSDVVGRFLRWVEDPSQRRIALDASIPRIFNLDIVEQLTMDESIHDLDTQFEWLCSMPFVYLKKQGWQYHPVVRTLVLRHLSQISATRFSEKQKTLSDYYAKRRNDRLKDREFAYSDQNWRTYTLEWLYHLLMSDAHANWIVFLEEFIRALRHRRGFASELISLTLSPDLDNFLSEEQQSEVVLFAEQLAQIEDDDFEFGFQMFQRLVKYADQMPAEISSIAYGFLALAEYEREEYVNAIEHYNEALSLRPNDSRLLARRGQVYIMLKEYDKALGDYSEAIKASPDFGWAVAGRGHIYRQLGQFDKAIVDLETAVSLDGSGEHLGCKELGLICFQQQQYDVAARYFVRAIETGAECYESWISLAKVLKLLQPCNEIALRLSTITLPEGADIGVVHCIRGSVLHSIGCHNSAVEELELAYQNGHRVHSLFPKLAISYTELGQYQEAIEAITIGLELAPDCEHCLLRRARLYKRVGENKKADADYKSIVNVALNDQNFNDIGLMLSHDYRFEEAFTLYERALLNEPEDPYASYNLAVLIARWKGADNASHEIHVANSKLLPMLESDDTAGTANYGIGGLNAVQGNITRALKCLEIALKQESATRSWVREDIAWDGIRDNLGFIELIAGVSDDPDAGRTLD